MYQIVQQLLYLVKYLEFLVIYQDLQHTFLNDLTINKL
jgi:hypothetical protein